MGITDWASERWDRRAEAEAALEQEEPPGLVMGDHQVTLAATLEVLDQKRTEILAQLPSTRASARMLEEFEAAATVLGMIVGPPTGDDVGGEHVA